LIKDNNKMIVEKLGEAIQTIENAINERGET
jgi:hypothetical protein